VGVADLVVVPTSAQPPICRRLCYAGVVEKELLEQFLGRFGRHNPGVAAKAEERVQALVAGSRANGLVINALQALPDRSAMGSLVCENTGNLDTG
jgi:hypothetical protein